MSKLVRNCSGRRRRGIDDDDNTDMKEEEEENHTIAARPACRLRSAGSDWQTEENKGSERR